MKELCEDIVSDCSSNRSGSDLQCIPNSSSCWREGLDQAGEEFEEKEGPLVEIVKAMHGLAGSSRAFEDFPSDEQHSAQDWQCVRFFHPFFTIAHLFLLHGGPHICYIMKCHCFPHKIKIRNFANQHKLPQCVLQTKHSVVTTADHVQCDLKMFCQTHC